jgi:hypothetical protein
MKTVTDRIPEKHNASDLISQLFSSFFVIAAPSMNRLLCSLTLSLLLLCVVSQAQTVADSVYIEGKILNLTGRLYREAPAVSFSRNNLLQTRSELTQHASLDADGSFKLALPLAFDQEEIYLDYGGKVFTTFLASPGTVNIVFDADSLYKSKRLFYYSGINADANNQYSRYAQEEDRLLKASKTYGTGFMQQLMAATPAAAKKLAQARAQYRLRALSTLTGTGELSPTLIKWVTAIVEEDLLSNLFEYSLYRELPLDSDLTESLGRLTKSPLTLQRIEWKNRFDAYAQRSLDQFIATNPSKSSALSISLIAQLIKAYVNPLSKEELYQLESIITNSTRTSPDIDFLSKLYARNRATLDILTDYEKKDKIYTALFTADIAEMLSAEHTAEGFYRLNLDRQRLVQEYVSKRIIAPEIRTSFNELYQLETRDSSIIRTIQSRTDLERAPKEVLPGIWMATSIEDGREWMKYIESVFKGKTIYISKWNLGDEESRNELALIPALQANTNAEVVYLFLHISQEDGAAAQNLWKQYIIRNNLKGVHLFMNEAQGNQLMFKINALAIPSFAIIRPNGKIVSKNASAPSAGKETATTLERISLEK